MFKRSGSFLAFILIMFMYEVNIINQRDCAGSERKCYKVTTGKKAGFKTVVPAFAPLLENDLLY